MAEHLDRLGAAVAGLIHRGLKQLRQTMQADEQISEIHPFSMKHQGEL